MNVASAPWTHDSALDFLIRRIDYERSLTVPYGEEAFRLDRMRDLLRRLGDPQRRLSLIHVAGTKGKGSTSAMIAAVLSASGRRTGLFSSPHLERIEERFRIDGQCCGAEAFAALVARLVPIVAEMDALAQSQGICEMGPTYFELTTALALLWFHEQAVDAAVLEVGLGGRLDSTNVITPLVSVITSISFDHTRQLGNTLAAIAGEKAGIIKTGVPVISGVRLDEPRQVIERVAREHGSTLRQIGVDFDCTYTPPRDVTHRSTNGEMTFREPQGTFEQLDHVELALLGRHQAANAAVALAALNELSRQGWQLSAEAIRRGLQQVCWPARVECVQTAPTVVLDAAHNVASIEALLETLDTCFAPSPRLLVFATTREKDIAGMLSRLLDHFETVVLTRYLNNPRGVPVAEVFAIAEQLLGADAATRRCLIADTPADAWELLRRRVTPEHLVCVAGSFFIAAEMRPLLRF